MQHTFQANTPDDMRPLASTCVDLAPDFPIILLKGELGAGKTTLAQYICAGLGIEGNITSPTYTLVNEYITNNTGQTVYHFDLYRIKDVEELHAMGFAEYIDSGHICLIEWPEIAEPYWHDMDYQEWVIDKTPQGRTIHLHTPNT